MREKIANILIGRFGRGGDDNEKYLEIADQIISLAKVRIQRVKMPRNTFSMSAELLYYACEKGREEAFDTILKVLDK